MGFLIELDPERIEHPFDDMAAMADPAHPLWVQLNRKTHAEFGIERLYLVSKGRRVSIAGFLGADEKASFAKALMEAIQAAKRGPSYNPIS